MSGIEHKVHVLTTVSTDPVSKGAASARSWMTVTGNATPFAASRAIAASRADG
jgi:hypothetical protein